MGLTRRQHPFYWLSQPSISFTIGTGSTYSLAAHITNPLGHTLTYSVRSGTLPNGTTLNPTTGLLTFSGASGLTASVQFVASTALFASDSASVPVTINTGIQANLPPVWALAPSVPLLIGTPATYNLAQHVSDPNSDPITYTALGTWPSGVSMSTAGLLTWTGTGTSGTTIVPVDAAEAGVSTSFFDIPEIAFLAGYAQVAQLGPFHLDVANRWTPGDLTRTQPSHRTGLPWTATGATQMVDATTLAVVSDTFVSYNSTTAELSYTGVDPGTQVHDRTVRLRVQTTGEVSPPFRIRVLRAKIVYGAGASTHAKFAYLTAAAKFDSSLGATWTQARQSSLFTGGSDTSPAVFAHLGGAYPVEDRFFADRRFIYVLGEPGSRPVLTGDDIIVSRSEIAYIKGFELISCRVTEVNARTDVATAIYFTECYQHHSTIDDSGLFNSSSVARDFERRIFVWNFQGAQMGGGNVHHGFYLEGRPGVRIQWNNLKYNGARDSSILKATCLYVHVVNSELVGVENEATPVTDTAAGKAAAIIIDVPCCSNIIVYNNRIAMYSDGGSSPNGQQHGALFWRGRRAGMFGCDIPAYPNLNYDLGTTSNVSYSAPPGFSGGPETYKNPAFWAAVSAKLMTDETNPYSFKKFVSYNQFVLLPGGNQTRVLRDDGSHPTMEQGILGPGLILPTHPAFAERSVTFLANNRYTGWAGTPSFDMDDYAGDITIQDTSVEGSPIWRANLSPPGNGRILPSFYRNTDIGRPDAGELIGAGTFNPVTLPSWFYIARFIPPPPEAPTVLQTAIEAIPAPYSFGPVMDVPSLAEQTPRLDPFNPDGQDYPDCAGGTTTYGYSMSRAWIWGSRFCWDPVKNRALSVVSPHGFDEFNGYHNGFITLLSMYDEATNAFVAYENPFSLTGNDTGVPNGVQNPLTVGHMFDTNCIHGRELLKWTSPRNPGGGVGYRQPQLMAIDLDALDPADVTTGRNGAAVLANYGRPSDTFPSVPSINDLTACAVDVFPNGTYVMLLRSTVYQKPLPGGAWTMTAAGFSETQAFHHIGHYHPNTGKFIAGGGAYFGTGVRNYQFITVDAAGNVVSIDNSPVCMSVSETNVGGEECKCVFVPDPASTESIVFHDNGNIYGVDPTRPAGSHWRTIGASSAGTIDWACAIWGRGILTGKSGTDGTATLRPYRAA